MGVGGAGTAIIAAAGHARPSIGPSHSDPNTLDATRAAAALRDMFSLRRRCGSRASAAGLPFGDSELFPRRGRPPGQTSGTSEARKALSNWTRSSVDILGSVFIYLDYTMPLEPLRQALREIVEKDARWDGKVCGLLVTNATERVIEVRALVSAASASRAFDLRCAVREKLIEYVRQNHPQSLPRMRAELEPPPSGSQAPADES